MVEFVELEGDQCGVVRDGKPDGGIIKERGRYYYKSEQGFKQILRRGLETIDDAFMALKETNEVFNYF